MQKTDIELNAEAQVIANETVAEANTKTRIAQILTDLTDSKPNNSVITTIQGNVSTAQSTADGAASAASAAQGNINTHIADVANPHGVTKTQVGLGSVDNTSDEDKPVSLATRQAIELATKVLVTGTIALDSTSWGKVHLLSGTSADYTVTLDTGIGNGGRMICFKGDPDPTILSKVVTIDGFGTQKIDNGLTINIASGGFCTLFVRETAGVASLDVLAYDQGAWITFTIGFTGFSANPTTLLSRYRISGRQVNLRITMGANGTSNATSFTITGIPSVISPVVGLNRQMAVVDNGAFVNGRIDFAGASTTINVYATIAAGNFTASGGKRVPDLNLTYDI